MFLYIYLQLNMTSRVYILTVHFNDLILFEIPIARNLNLGSLICTT